MGFQNPSDTCPHKFHKAIQRPFKERGYVFSSVNFKTFVLHIEKKKKHTRVNFFKTRLILSAHIDILPVDIHTCLLAECSMQGLEHYLGDLIWLSILLLFSFVLYNMYGTPQIKIAEWKVCYSTLWYYTCVHKISGIWIRNYCVTTAADIKPMRRNLCACL